MVESHSTPPEPKSPRGSRPVRADIRLAECLGVSHREARRLLLAGPILVDGEPRRVAKGEYLLPEAVLDVPDFVRPESRVPLPNSEGELTVLAEGPGWLAVSKPAGLPVHPLEREESGTVLNRLVARYPELSGVGEAGLRSGVVHRLDVPTSGVLLFARDDATHQRLRELFREHRVEKVYRAWVQGTPPRSGRLALELYVARHREARVRVADGPQPNSREARLHWRRLRDAKSAAGLDCTELRIELETGFLHQIRASFEHLGHPVLGDPLYGDRETASRLMLHAESLRIPELGIDVRCPLPEGWDFPETPRG